MPTTPSSEFPADTEQAAIIYEDHFDEDDDSDEDPTFEDPDEAERKAIGKRRRGFADPSESFSSKRSRTNRDGAWLTASSSNAPKFQGKTTGAAAFQQDLQAYQYRGTGAAAGTQPGQTTPAPMVQTNPTLLTVEEAEAKREWEQNAAKASAAETEVKQYLFEHFQRVSMGSYPRDASMALLKGKIRTSPELIEALGRIQARAAAKGNPAALQRRPFQSRLASTYAANVTVKPNPPLVKQRLNAEMADSLLRQGDGGAIKSAFRDSFESEVNKISEAELNRMSETDRNMYFTLRRCEAIAIRLRSALHDNLQGILETNSLSNAPVGAPDGEEKKKEVNNDNHIVTEQPEMLQLALKEYQLVGLNWLNLLHVENINGILADEMGLGKTIQTISLLALIHERERPTIPHLIICPSTTLSNWIREITKWCPQFRVVAYYGSTEERAAIRSRILTDGFDIIVTTYKISGMKKDRLFLKRVEFCYVVLDEAQGIKNKDSLRHQGLRKINSQHRLLLTGTPLQNNLEELWALLQFIMPDVFDYDLDLSNEELDEEAMGKRVTRMKSIMAPFVLRRLKQHVSRDLPSKSEATRECEMTPMQKELYYACVQSSRSWWEKMKDSGSMSEIIDTADPDLEGESSEPEDLEEPAKRQRGWNVPKPAPAPQRPTTMTGRTLNNVFMQLRKISNHPLLVRSSYTDEVVDSIVDHLMTLDENKRQKREQMLEDVANKSDFRIHQICKEKPALAGYMLSPQQLLGSGKVQALKTLLGQLHAEGHRVLIFSQMTRVLDILQEVLDLWSYEYLRLDGQTPVSTRQSLIDRYNTDPRVFIFLLSTRAGGVGINLTSADTVVFYDIAFNPQVDRQAEDRCHRFGQTRPVTIYKLITARTVDQNMLQMAERKAELNDVMLEEGKKKKESTKVWQLRSLLSSVFEEIQ